MQNLTFITLKFGTVNVLNMLCRLVIITRNALTIIKNSLLFKYVFLLI